ncbi:hypothetical protein AMTRI_Chr07g76830 [Amborella trichopoda]
MKILFPFVSRLSFFFHPLSISTLTYSNIFPISILFLSLPSPTPTSFLSSVLSRTFFSPFLHLQREIQREKAKQGERACCLNFSIERERIGINFDFMSFLDSLKSWL